MIVRALLIILAALAFGSCVAVNAMAQESPPVPDIRGGRDGDNIGMSWVKSGAALSYELDRQAGGSSEWVPIQAYPAHLPVGEEIIYTEPLRLGPGPYCFRVRAIEGGIASGYATACIPVSPGTTGATPPAPVVSGTMTSSGGGSIAEPYWQLSMSWRSVIPAGSFNGYETWVLRSTDRAGNAGETIYRHMDTIIASGEAMTFGSWSSGLTTFGSCVKVRAIAGSQVGPFSDPICRTGDTMAIAYETGGAVPAAQAGANPVLPPYTAPATVSKAGPTIASAPTPRPPATGTGGPANHNSNWPLVVLLLLVSAGVAFGVTRRR